MAGPFDFSASSFMPGGQGTNNQTISPEMLAQLMALMQGGGKGADLSLLSQAIAPSAPRFAALPITPSGGQKSALQNALTGQVLPGAGGGGQFDWMKALAGDIAGKVGNVIPNPVVAQPAATPAPATNTPLGGTTYRGPNIEDWQKAIQPAQDLVNNYVAGTQNMKPGDPIDWGKLYADNIAPVLGGLAGNMGFTGAGTDAMIQRWQDASKGLSGPLPQDPNQTGLQNVGAALGNSFINFPENMARFFLKGPIDAGTALGKNLWDFATKSEAQRNAEDKAKWDKEHPSAGQQVQFNLTPQGQAPLPGVTSSGLPTPAPLQTNVGGGTQTAAPGTPANVIDSYVAQTTQRESGGNPNAQNPNSSAGGLGQFTDGTWKEYVLAKHPDWFSYMTDKEIRQKKFDPAESTAATRWYAEKGADLLDSLNLPVTSANLYAHHFLGPAGAKAFFMADPDTPVSDYLPAATIKANPFLKGMTTQDLHDNFEASHGDPANIVGRGPTARPQQVGPDTAETMKWVEEARPKPTDKQLLANAQFGDMMAGIGEGLGMDFNGGGQLFGNLAAGAGKGLAASSGLALNASNADELARSTYASGRGDLALKLATLQSDLANGNMDRAWQDKQDISNWMNQRTNTQMELRQKQYELAKEAATPKVLHTSDNALVYQDATGVHKVDLSSNTFADQYKKIGEAFGLNSAQAQQMKYNDLTKYGIDAYTHEMVNDAIASGDAQKIFGADNYKAAMDAAKKEVEDQGMNIADPKYQDALNQRLAGWLFVGTKQTGDTSWVERMKDMGNPGAIYLWNNRTSTPAPTQ